LVTGRPATPINVTGGTMQLNFVTVDVFTDRPFGGNPLAVVPDARGVTTEQMQAIAAEFNLSETTFVLPPEDPAHAAHVRIFTPRAELPFAGHPNVGTAFVLASAAASAARPADGDTMIFEEKAGLVPMMLLRDGAAVTGARLAAPQGLSVGETIARETVAGPSDGRRQRHAGRPARFACRRAGRAAGVADLAGRGLGAAEPHGGVSGKAGRQGGRRTYRRQLRAGDERGHYVLADTTPGLVAQMERSEIWDNGLSLRCSAVGTPSLRHRID
jgi:hypothetical protein